MTLPETEHRLVLGHARTLIEGLAGFDGRIESGDVSYEHHRVYARRAASLADQLRCAMELVANHQYSAAFCLLRPALEQIVFDRLLVFATRYVQRIPDVPEPTYAQWRADWKSGVKDAEHILRMERNDKGVVRLELHGLEPSDPMSAGQILSVYFFLLQEYQPFIAAPKDQSRLLPQFRSKERQAHHARVQHEMYHTSLRWPVLLDNLRRNALASSDDLLRIEVQYRFLSAFVHPLSDNYRLLYGNSHDLGRPLRYDHYSSELVLLYIVAFAAYEIDTLLRARERPPVFTVRDGAVMTRQLQTAQSAIAYLWFVGDAPHEFDSIAEANQRIWSLPQEQWGEVPKPASLLPEDIRYYQDPLRRLIKLHDPSTELMGHSFVSPWPRPDARFR